MTNSHHYYTRSLYIDLELSCWLGHPPDGLDNNIIQIGLVEADLITLSISRRKAYYIKPAQFEISKYCTELTGITHQHIIKYGRPLTEVMTSIQNEYGPKNKMCFAWGNDNNSIQNECLQNNIANPFGRTIIDLGTLFRGTFLMKNRMKLKDALTFLGLPFEGTAHDALVDAENTAKLHLEMIRRLRGTQTA